MPTAFTIISADCSQEERERERRLPEVEMGEAGMTLIRTLTTVMVDV